jgi:hypothetical protein
MNIPPEFVKDYHGQYSGVGADSLFVHPLNREYMLGMMKEFDPEVIIRYMANFRFPFFEQFKYKDQKDILSVYNTTLLNNIRHVAYYEKLFNKDHVPDTHKYGLTEESFANGFYSPLDYIENNVFNNEPAWKRRVVSVKTHRKDKLREAVMGGTYKDEHPGGQPFWALGRWNRHYDYEAVNEGLVQSGQADRLLRGGDNRYPLDDLKAHYSSAPHIDPSEILRDGSV